MSLKPLPNDLLAGLPARFVDYLRHLDREIRELRNSIDSASGELLGNEDLNGAIPANSSAATVADLRTDFNTLLTSLRGL